MTGFSSFTSQQRGAILLLAFGLWALVPSLAEARAFCSLRDPISAIRQLFPSSNGFLSTVRVINAEARTKVATMLPFTIHYNELGKHTLYTALDQKHPLGFVHVRSEMGSWGLMEVAWALTPELVIRDLSFQRCRSSVCNEPMRVELSQLVGGKSWIQLAGLLESDGANLKQNLTEKYGANANFVLAIVKSAMKTALVTEISWPQEVARVMAANLSNAGGHAGVKGAEFRKHSVSSAAVASLRERNGELAISFPELVEVFALHRGADGQGWLVTNPWRWNGQSGTGYWLFSSEGKVEGLRSLPVRPAGPTTAAFRSVVGQVFTHRADCETWVELMATDLFSLALASLEE